MFEFSCKITTTNANKKVSRDCNQFLICLKKFGFEVKLYKNFVVLNFQYYKFQK